MNLDQISNTIRTRICVHIYVCSYTHTYEYELTHIIYHYYWKIVHFQRHTSLNKYTLIFVMRYSRKNLFVETFPIIFLNPLLSQKNILTCSFTKEKNHTSKSFSYTQNVLNAYSIGEITDYLSESFDK